MNKIAKCSKLFSDGVLVKKCLSAIVNILCPKKRMECNSIKSFLDSGWYINGMADDIHLALKKLGKAFSIFLIALYKSRHNADTAQLFSYGKFISVLNALVYTFSSADEQHNNRGRQFLRSKNALDKLELNWAMLYGIVTNGVLAMIGSHKGAVSDKDKITERA